ncbi:MAG: TesB-like acyl-CoA thioesterase 1 [Myxococcales bacterium]|nr:TesB-like acyl-CoA thioesterase 1 [Myxococcales bacterium]
MPTLSDLTTPARHGDHYQLAVPEGWRQGRGAFGGFVVSALIRAIEHAVGDPTRTVRSVTAEIPGPVLVGTAEIAVEILRQGSSVSTVRAALTQGSEVKTHAVGVLAATRRGTGPLAWQELAPPAAPPWSGIEPLPMAAGAFPEFAQHFEYRVVEGIPTSGAAPRTVGWIRPRLQGGLRDAAHIAAVMDAWWPAALVKLPAMRPMATIVYTLDIVGGLDGLDPESPLLYRGTAPVLADGYCLETRELWGEDGRLVAINHQTFVVIA